MTQEQIDAWKVERDIARQSGDDALMQKAYDHRDEMMMVCISHQSSRVKKLVDDVEEIKTDLKPCKESDREYREAKLKAKGAKWAFGIIAGAATVVGPVVAIKLCKLAGILW